MKALALYSLKGGVGKTTAAVHLAHLAAHAGRTTLLWDLDPQGSASWIYRVRVDAASRPKRWLREPAELWAAIRGSDWPGLDLLPADLALGGLEASLGREEEPVAALAAVLAELGTRYERIVLDCPPAFSRLVRCALQSVHALVVPTIPTPLALRTLATLYPELKAERRRGLRVLPFFSMVDARKALHREVRAFARREGLGFLASEVPYSARVESVTVQRRPLTAAASEAAAAPFVELAREIEAHLAADADAPRLGRARIAEFVQGLGRRPLSEDQPAPAGSNGPAPTRSPSASPERT
ncbi:MAG TPA: ParA family protein [Planctomycetota bacterium]